MAIHKSIFPPRLLSPLSWDMRGNLPISSVDSSVSLSNSRLKKVPNKQRDFKARNSSEPGRSQILSSRKNENQHKHKTHIPSPINPQNPSFHSPSLVTLHSHFLYPSFHSYSLHHHHIPYNHHNFNPHHLHHFSPTLHHRCPPPLRFHHQHHDTSHVIRRTLHHRHHSPTLLPSLQFPHFWPNPRDPFVEIPQFPWSYSLS